MFKAAGVVAAVTACAFPGALAHDRHFEGHPEWDNIWPDPFSLNDLKHATSGDTPPDLSGIWTGSPLGAPNARYFMTPSGGGYGSSKDRSFAAAAPRAPGTAYDVRCISGDFTDDGDTPCGWDSALVEVAPSTNSASTSSNWTATISFLVNGQVSTKLSGAIENGNRAIAMDEPWNHFTGELSGLWKGPSGDDFYVLTHDADSGNLTVMWDTSETPVGGWYTGTGSFDQSSNAVDMKFDSFELKGVTNPPDFNAIGNGTWGADWTKRPVQTYPSDIHTVHLIFMNHLDIGYTTTINNVLNEYIHQYFTQVENLGDEMRALEGTDRFVYITHPWLMSLLFDCPCGNETANCTARSLDNPFAPPLACGSADELARFRRAVSKGDIAWHAAPMNNQFENQSPSLVEAGLKLTRMYVVVVIGRARHNAESDASHCALTELHHAAPPVFVFVFVFCRFDEEFYGNGSDAQKTITMSDRDVIYVTRSMIPFLSEYGVEGLTIGSNGANYPPQVPKLHVWRDEASGKDVIVVYHPYGYGGYSKSTCDGPGQCGDCAEAPNGVAICTEFRTDNTGPPASTDEVLQSLDAVRQE